MKTYLFPYGGSFGGGDSWEGANEVELTDEEAERLEASARKESRYELDEDPEISDIHDKVYAYLYNHDLEELLNDEYRIRELREDYEDENGSDSDNDGEKITNRQLAEEYLDNTSFSVYYPEELQELRICALCGEELEEDDEGQKLKDGRIVCENCAEYNCGCCDQCGDYVEEDDLTYWGDDMRLCPDCFKEEFPPFNKADNDAETQEAYDAMRARLIGRKTELKGPRTVSVETEMDEDSYKYGIEAEIDEEGKICDVSRLSIERCRAIWVTGEDWLNIPVNPDDYEEDGRAEQLILDGIEEQEEEEELEENDEDEDEE